MRVLLDNCVPRRINQHIVGHEIATSVEMGWADLDDGPLLHTMDGQFDVPLTVDRSLRFQQRLAGRSVAVGMMRAKSKHIRDLSQHIPAALATLETITAGQVIEVGGDQ